MFLADGSLPASFLPEHLKLMVSTFFTEFLSEDGQILGLIELSLNREA